MIYFPPPSCAPLNHRKHSGWRWWWFYQGAPMNPSKFGCKNGCWNHCLLSHSWLCFVSTLLFLFGGVWKAFSIHPRSLTNITPEKWCLENSVPSWLGFGLFSRANYSNLPGSNQREIIEPQISQWSWRNLDLKSVTFHNSPRARAQKNPPMWKK